GAPSVPKAERGEVHPVDGLVDLAADALREEVLRDRVADRDPRCVVAARLDVELAVRQVAARPRERGCGSHLAVVAGVVERQRAAGASSGDQEIEVVARVWIVAFQPAASAMSHLAPFRVRRMPFSSAPRDSFFATTTSMPAASRSVVRIWARRSHGA